MKEKLFLYLKLCAAVFNGLATYLVFLEIFREGKRGEVFAVISSFLAVVLIDLFFLVALYVLEDKKVPLPERLVWSVSAILLSLAVLSIGVADEGILGIVPRVGFILLVWQDVISVYTEYTIQYNSREAQERRIRDAQVILRRKEVSSAYRRMIKSQEMRNLFQEREKQRELANLNITTQPVESTPLPEETLREEVEPGLVQLATGGYGWINPDGELTTVTTLGKAYSYQGARNALARSKNGRAH